jgi:energy-coupling factor transport system ATP-binding protein
MNQPANIKFIDGNNFSGRTHYLKTITGFNNNDLSTVNGVYLGPVPTSYISGLATRVKEEFQLHSGKTVNNSDLEFIISTLNLSHLLYSNPFTLSGGEQAMVAMIDATLLRPHCIGFDTLLEQVNDQWKLPFLKMASDGQLGDMQFLVADNRSDEMNCYIEHTRIPSGFLDEEIEQRYTFHPINHNKFSTQFYSNRTVSLSIRNLSYKYKKGRQVLKDVNIDLAPGMVYHLQGINGAGKSTFSKLLTGILKTQDDSKLFGDGLILNPYKHPGKLVGYGFQNPDEQLFETTIEEEILPKAFNSAIDIRRRQMILETFGLQDVAKEHPEDMPFTIRKRIALAATLGIDRPWYILDEPTIGIDNENVLNLVHIIQQLVYAGKSIIYVSHSGVINHYIRNITPIQLINGKIT